MSGFDYRDVQCPMPDCTERLHIEWTSSYTLSLGDLAHDAELPDAPGAHVSTWTVGCTAGHVVLVPGDFGCGCDDPEGPDCSHDPEQFDWDDEDRKLRRHDIVRLRELVPHMAALAEAARS